MVKRPSKNSEVLHADITYAHSHIETPTEYLNVKDTTKDLGLCLNCNQIVYKGKHNPFFTILNWGCNSPPNITEDEDPDFDDF